MTNRFVVDRRIFSSWMSLLPVAGAGGFLSFFAADEAEAKRIPAGPVNLDTTDHHALVIEGGRERILSSSRGYNPDQRRTAASHIKLLTALVAFEQMQSNKALDTSHNAALLAQSLIKSDNRATEALARAIAGTEENFIKLMQRKAQQLGLRGTTIANSSGDPEAAPGPRQDSFSTASDLKIVAAALAQTYTARLFQIYGLISEKFRPTSSLFYPLPYRHKTPDKGVLMFSKTATDKFQNGSQIVVVIMGGKTFIFQHVHTDKAVSPSAVTAKIMQQVFEKSGVKRDQTNSDFFAWLDQVASGKRQPAVKADPVRKAPAAAPVAPKAAPGKGPIRDFFPKKL